ncbi:MAG: hypothetical protein A2X12_09545 [Bacteroidetes bacterium GWE2_29_8]|nr:MAG: hypothetical protein A2X12_09545 [Bacteroidetes bacterium GWE2_29_8]OFY17747.1 MAG: hypothetical protein A2X02_03675 [Bacteroidetes bacterium GWF2_29_10]
MELIKDIISEAITITGFVMSLLLLIEYVTVMTRGDLFSKLSGNSWLQIIVAGLLGLIPGCVGGFAAVSLYTHRIINLPALVTVMIASFGDESIIMFGLIPETAIKLSVIIFIIAIIVGFIMNVFFKNKFFKTESVHFLKTHSHDDECITFSRKIITKQLKEITFTRLLLISGGVFLLILLLFDKIGGGHNHGAEEHLEQAHWGFEKIIFLILILFSVFAVSTVPEHFLKKHLWEHIIKKHFIKILIWTLLALVFIKVGLNYFDINQWVEANHLSILVIALLLGIIPESGPHIVFITLFANGSIPFSVLLANSIVQDGHSGLPLLAESKKTFIVVKLINVMVGLSAGIAGYLMGW